MYEIYNATVIRWLLIWNDFLAWFDDKIIDGIVNLSATVVRVFSVIDGWIDEYIVDGSVNALASVVKSLGKTVRLVQTGQVQNYILGAVLGTVIIIILTLI